MPRKPATTVRRRRRGRRYNLTKKIQSVLNKNMELKKVILTQSFDIPANTAGNNRIVEFSNNINQGDGIIQRTGNKIIITSVHVEGFLNVADDYNNVRVLLLLMKDPSQQFDGMPFNGYPTDNTVTVLADRFITLSNAGSRSKRFLLRKIFRSGNRKGLEVQYSSSVGTSVTKNNLKLVLISDSTAASHPTFTGVTKCYFSDA